MMAVAKFRVSVGPYIEDMFWSSPNAALYISDKNDARYFDIELGHVKPSNIFYRRNYP